MPNVDPTVRFWIGVVVTLAIGISQGTVNIKGAIPAEWVSTILVWAGIIAFFGSSLLTALNGGAMTTSSRIASAAAVDGVRGIVVDPKIVVTAVEAAGGNANVTTVPAGRSA